jgi:hypothetical protein
LSDMNLFAGTQHGGVFLSNDNGNSWIQTGLTDGWVTALVVRDSSLFAGTQGNGVWRRPLYEMITSTDPVRSEMPCEFFLWQNYPNPFNPSTTIKYELPEASVVRLNVYDMLGREVSVVVNERRDAGVHQVKFDGSGLSSGVYLYSLQAGTFVQTRKLLLLQ